MEFLLSVTQSNVACLGKSSTEMPCLIKKVYKEEALSKAQIFRWRNKVQKGRENVEDLE